MSTRSSVLAKPSFHFLVNYYRDIRKFCSTVLECHRVTKSNFKWRKNIVKG